MAKEVKSRGFDFVSCSAGAAVDVVLSRLSDTGAGHTPYCVFKGANHPSQLGCPSCPSSWRPPVIFQATLASLLSSGQVERIGSYLWLNKKGTTGKL